MNLLMVRSANRPPATSAFSLLELVVVIAIIIVLAGISVAVTGVIRASQRTAASRLLVQTVAQAVDAYSVTTLQPASGSGVTTLRPMWDADLDFVLDPRPAAHPPLQSVAPPWYAGFAAMAGRQLPVWAVGPDGHVVDRWGTPLRIDWPGWRTDAQKDAAGVGAARGDGRLYGMAKAGIWSLGPDRADGAPDSAAETDNLRSW